MRKLLLIAAVVSGLMFAATTAGAVLAGASQPTFGATAVTWTTPAACDQHDVQPCNFLLWVNEPNVPHFVGAVQGGANTGLGVDYPTFCGVVQADVFVQITAYPGGQFTYDGKGWVYAVAESNGADRHVISNCTPPTTTTTEPSTTTTTVPPTTTTTAPPAPPTTTVPPVKPTTCVGTGCGHPQPPMSTPPTLAPPAAAPLPVSAPQVAPQAPVAPPVAVVPVLAYTGLPAHFWSLLWGGLFLALLGLFLLTPRRRTA